MSDRLTATQLAALMAVHAETVRQRARDEIHRADRERARAWVEQYEAERAKKRAERAARKNGGSK